MRCVAEVVKAPDETDDEKAAQKLIDRRMVSYKGQRRAIKRCINSKINRKNALAFQKRSAGLLRIQRCFAVKTMQYTQ